MDDSAEPEIIFSELTREVMIDGHRFAVEIYRSTEHPGWILSVENRFATLTISDNPPYLADGLAWREFERLVAEEGIRAFYSAKERRKLRL